MTEELEIVVVVIAGVAHVHVQGCRFEGKQLLDSEPQPHGLVGVGAFKMDQRSGQALGAAAEGLARTRDMHHTPDRDLPPLGRFAAGLGHLVGDVGRHACGITDATCRSHDVSAMRDRMHLRRSPQVGDKRH